MTFVINSLESIDNLALAYFDEQEEVLKEVTEDDLIFPVFSNKRIIKRLYVIGDLLYNNQITVEVTTDSSQYRAKIAIGRDTLRYSDFDEYTNIQTTTYAQSPYKLLNALPVDIYIESLGVSTEDVGLDIQISVEG